MTNEPTALDKMLMSTSYGYWLDENVKKAARAELAELRAAVARERERCAKIADEHLNDEKKALNAGGYIEACMHIAAAIRAQTTPHESTNGA